MALTYFQGHRLIKEKSLSSRYLHTYHLCYFHINTSDPYNETQGPVHRWVTLSYFSRAWRLMKENGCHFNIFTPTICITSILILVMHMMNVKVILLHNLCSVHLSLILRAGIPSEAVSLFGTQRVCVLKGSL